MNQKMQWLRNQLLSLNLQGMIIANPINIRYLTKIEAEGILLLTRKENILAEVNDPNVEQTETIWSKEKDVEGWTFTGNTKEE